MHPLPGAVDEAEAFLANHPETREHCDRVVELIDGFETPYRLELLATTHWVATHVDADTPASAAQRVRAWSHRNTTSSPTNTAQSPGNASMKADGSRARASRPGRKPSAYASRLA